MLDRFLTLPAGFVTRDGERLSKSAYAFLILLCLAFFLPGFTTLPVTDRDEARFAQATKQMIESGNYTDIRFQNEPRYKKPIGIYWLQAASVKLLNPHHLDAIWAYRVPSLIGATLAVVMTAALGALLFGPMAGLLAAIMMAGCLILNVEARLAKTDAALLGSIMVAQYALARAYLACHPRESGDPDASVRERETTALSASTGDSYPRRRASLDSRLRGNDKKNFFAFWTALAAGILIKGPIILLIVLSTLLWLRLTEKNLKWFGALKPILGILYTLLLVAPWFAAIMIVSKGEFAAQAGWHDLLAKLWESQGHKYTPFGVYLLAFPFTFFPFSLWSLLAVPDAWRNRREPAVRFCLGWLVPSWIVFEIAFTKLPHYVMPLYPAIAFLSAKFLCDGYPTLVEAKRIRWLPPLMIVLWLATGLMLLGAAVFMPDLMDQVWNPGLIAACAIVLIAQIATVLFFARRQESGIIVMTASSLLLMTYLFANTMPHINHMWPSREIVRTAESIKPCAGDLKIASTYNEPSLVFLAGTDTQLLNDGRDIAEAMKRNACLIGVVDESKKQDFLDAFPVGDQPSAVAAINGINMGDGRPMHLSLYILPAKKP